MTLPPEDRDLIERLREFEKLPTGFRWTGTAKVEDLFDAELRHETGKKPVAYLKAWLSMLRPFAFATKDDSWGEMEKLLCIVMSNYVRMKELCGQAAEALAAVRAEAAPVVDEAAVDRAIAAVNAFGPEPMALEDRRRALIRAALEAALNPSPTGGQDHE